jgi:hypothetical protein
VTRPNVEYRARIRANAGIRRRYDDREEVSVVDPAKFPPVSDVEVCVLATAGVYIARDVYSTTVNHCPR